MSSFDSKSDQVQGRQLKVQRLVIPFSIVGNATSTSVVQRSDEPSLMFIKTQGVDDITGALDDGDTATYVVDADNGNGTFNVLIKVEEQVSKVCQASCVRRGTALADADDAMIVALGNSSGVVQTSDGNGDKIMLTIDGELALNDANTLDACLQVDYIVAE